MRWLLLLLLLRSSLGQLLDGTPAKRDISAMMNMPQITNIDVDCGRTGMTVKVEFSQPFDGVIYSKGHFNDPSCRYVGPSGNQASYTFKISPFGCGTHTGDVSETKSSVSNTIIIQMDPEVQEIWDSAKKLSCIWTSRFPKKEIKFDPFEVSMLQVVSMSYEGDEINCWMDIQKGVYPETSAITGSVEIGDEISMLIFLQDTEDKADVGVRDCWAFTGDSFEDESTTRVQLTSSTGCILRPKLMGPWKKTRTIINSRDTLVAHSTISAFKFPDQRQIHLMCNAEVCYGQCQQCEENENVIQSHQKSSDDVVHIENLEEVSQQDIPPPAVSEEETSNTLGDIPENSNKILDINKEFPSIDVQDVQEEEQSFSPNDEGNPKEDNVEKPLPTEDISPQSGDCSELENCEPTIDSIQKENDDTSGPKPSVISILNCFPGSQDILCRSIADRPEVVIDKCSPGSTDPRCSWTVKHFNEIDCTTNSEHPQCLNLQDIIPADDCTEGSSNPNCLSLSQEINCDINIDDPNCKSFQDVISTTESSQILCETDSSDPRCNNEMSSSCNADSNDPNCLTDISQNDITSVPDCNPESNDSNCVEEPTTEMEEQNICILQPDDPSCTQTEITNECTEGSENPECIDQSLNINNCDPTSTDPACNAVPNSNTEETDAFDCSKDPSDHRCLNEPSIEVDCSIQPDDPQCIDSISTVESNAQNVECQSDSTNINCIDQSTVDVVCDPNSNDPQCQSQPTDPIIETQCSEDSIDLNCLRELSQIKCSLYPDNPLCQFGDDLPPADQVEEEVVCDENSLDQKCQQNIPTDDTNIDCPPLSLDIRCLTLSLQDICFPGSRDVRCRIDSNSSSSESESQEPVTDQKPKPTRVKMTKKDDFHGDKNPRYHAFHSWLFLPAPRPRSRGKRSFSIPSINDSRNPKFIYSGNLVNKSRSITLTNHSGSLNNINTDKYKSKEYILSVNTVFEKIPRNQKESYSIIKEKIDFTEYSKARKQLIIFILSFCCIFSFFILLNFYLCKVEVENRAFNV